MNTEKNLAEKHLAGTYLALLNELSHTNRRSSVIVYLVGDAGWSLYDVSYHTYKGYLRYHALV